MIRRPPRSTPLYSSAASDVYKRQGDQLNNIHEACSESQDYLFEIKQVINKLNLKMISAGSVSYTHLRAHET